MGKPGAIAESFTLFRVAQVFSVLLVCLRKSSFQSPEELIKVDLYVIMLFGDPVSGISAFVGDEVIHILTL